MCRQASVRKLRATTAVCTRSCGFCCRAGMSGMQFRIQALNYANLFHVLRLPCLKVQNLRPCSLQKQRSICEFRSMPQHTLAQLNEHQECLVTSVPLTIQCYRTVEYFYRGRGLSLQRLSLQFVGITHSFSAFSVLSAAPMLAS